MAIRCRECNGRGTVPCRHCKGKGDVYEYMPIAPEAGRWVPCDHCNGTGRVPCPNPRCDGGWIRQVIWGEQV